MDNCSTDSEEQFNSTAVTSEDAVSKTAVWSLSRADVNCVYFNQKSGLWIKF